MFAIDSSTFNLSDLPNCIPERKVGVQTDGSFLDTSKPIFMQLHTDPITPDTSSSLPSGENSRLLELQRNEPVADKMEMISTAKYKRARAMSSLGLDFDQTVHDSMAAINLDPHEDLFCITPPTYEVFSTFRYRHQSSIMPRREFFHRSKRVSFRMD